MKRPAFRTSCILVFFAFFLVSVHGTLQAQVLRAEIDLLPDGVLGIEEEAILEIRISTEGTEMRIPDPRIELVNFRIVSGPEQASSLMMYNGKPSASRTLTWRLRPLAEGTAWVRDVRIEVGRQVLRLPDRRVEVQRDPPASRRLPPGSDLDRFSDPNARLGTPPGWERSGSRRARRSRSEPRIFLRAEIEPREPYAGQQVLYTVYLYTQVDIDSVNPENVPDFKGFWARVVPQPENLRPEMVESRGERIGRVVLLERALFARRPGQFVIDPVDARMVAQLPERGARGALRARRREIVRSSNAVTLRVRPLPPDPNGHGAVAVGRLDLHAKLTPTEINVGEAVALEVALEGQGHLQGIAAPQLPEIPGVDVFPPQQQSSEEVEGKNLHGRRVWTYVLTPRRPGSWQLPPLEIPFFDPATGTYQVAVSEALDLQVGGAAMAASIHPIRSAVRPEERGTLATWIPWLFGAPWLVLALAIWLRLPAIDPARRALMERLESAREERPSRAAVRVEEAWREYLLERWDLPTELAASRWSESLKQRGASDAAVADVARLVDDLHYLRHAPKLSQTEALRDEIFRLSEQLLRASRRWGTPRG